MTKFNFIVAIDAQRSRPSDWPISVISEWQYTEQNDEYHCSTENGWVRAATTSEDDALRNDEAEIIRHLKEPVFWTIYGKDAGMEKIQGPAGHFLRPGSVVFADGIKPILSEEPLPSALIISKILGRRIP